MISKKQKKSIEDRKKVHMNKPQVLFYLVQAAINVLIWGRGTGKSEGPIAIFSNENMRKMPRSNGILIGTTYEQLLTRTLPPLIAGWERLGYQMNKHFFIRKFAPESYKFEKAYRTPVKADHYIHWYDGSGIYLVSQDRPGTANGISADWLAGDEARFLRRDRLRDTLLTIRGNAQHFGHLSNHGSILFCTDMPTTSKGNWLFDYKDQMDPEVIEGILKVQVAIGKLKDRLEQARPSTKKRLSAQLNRYQKYLNELRKDTVYYSIASTLDNVHALGLNPIKNFKRQLTDLEYQTSVLSKKVLKVEKSFYGGLDDDIHGYDAFNYGHIDNLEMDYKEPDEQDSRWDGDIMKHEPLDISADYNSEINSLVVGQPGDQEYRMLNAMFVTRPKKLRHLIEKFSDYYKDHPCKEVNYFFDHTAIATDASSDVSFADEWIEGLRKRGWTVHQHYIGQAPSHHSRHLLWQVSFDEKDTRTPRFRFNKSNCKFLQVSMEQAPVRQFKGKFQKDKSSEKDPNVPPEESTHLSEAADILWYARHRDCLSGASEFTDVMFPGG